jgi:hypothetical protein
MTDYPHKPFRGQTTEYEEPDEGKRKRQKQLDEVRKRRATIFKMMKRMGAK